MRVSLGQCLGDWMAGECFAAQGGWPWAAGALLGRFAWLNPAARAHRRAVDEGPHAHGEAASDRHRRRAQADRGREGEVLPPRQRWGSAAGLAGACAAPPLVRGPARPPRLTPPHRVHKRGRRCARVQELGCTRAQLALAWCVRNPDVSTVITGATKLSQVRGAVGPAARVPRASPGLQRCRAAAAQAESGRPLPSPPPSPTHRSKRTSRPWIT